MSVATVAVFATVCRAAGLVPKNPSFDDAELPIDVVLEPMYA